jgi:hypothetical protein
MLADYLRWLIAPGKDRWQPMLMGLALFGAGAAAAVSLQLPQPVPALLLLASLAAWFVGACGMVGYVRWIYASELKLQKDQRDQIDPKKRGEK